MGCAGALLTILCTRCASSNVAAFPVAMVTLFMQREMQTVDFADKEKGTSLLKEAKEDML